MQNNSSILDYWVYEGSEMLPSYKLTNFRDADRRHKSPGAETKDFITDDTASSKGIMLAPHVL